MGLLIAALMIVSAVAGRAFLPDTRVMFGVASSSAPGPNATPIATPYRAKVEGRYYSDAGRSQFLEFRSDGTVFMSIGGGISTFAVDGKFVVISTTFAGAARGELTNVVVVANPPYSGIGYERIFFPDGQGTIQHALSGGWERKD
jgi:hypothetical protein